jgi:hypothetical protein
MKENYSIIFILFHGDVKNRKKRKSVEKDGFEMRDNVGGA